MGTKESEEYYLRVVDDSLSRSYGFKSGFYLWYIIFPVIAAIPAAIVRIIISSDWAMVITFVVTYAALIWIWLHFRVKYKEKQEEINKKRAPISAEEYETLEKLLARCGEFASFISYGDVVEKNSRFPIVPVKRGKFCFIRASRNGETLSIKERKLIQRLFNFEKNEEIIWFMPKDKKPFLTLNFVSEDGEEFIFRHGYHQIDTGYQSIEYKDGECLLHIYDSVPR